MQSTFQERVRIRAEGEMRELAREELAMLAARGQALAAGVDPEQLVARVLEEVLPRLAPVLGESLAALILRAGVIERIDARFGLA